MIQNTPVSKGKLTSYTFDTQSGSNLDQINFQFNPTSIEEKRGVAYNFSEGQGQVLPLAQYGRVEPTELTFDLFLFDHKGVKDRMNALRYTTQPRQITRKFEYYSQSQPHRYTLNLSGYGIFNGVVRSVSFRTDMYHRNTMEPIRVTARMNFVVVHRNHSADLTMIRSQGNYDR
jgi:hypothetical protein